MKLLIDSANLEAIARIIDLFPIAGVTTNPTILLREKRDPWQSLSAIRKLIGDDLQLHSQVVSQNAGGMVEEAEYIRDRLGENTFIKVPVSQQGLKAIRKLSSQNFHVTATAVYTPVQALLAATAGAEWLAPYINRLEMIGSNGVQVAGEIQKLLENQHSQSAVLAASFKNVEQILQVLLTGVTGITAAPEVIETLLNHPLTDKAIEDFTCDFEKLTAAGQTLMSI